jgi:thioredoxin reductase (NADPH)
MANKPILLVVDDNPDVLGAIAGDLRTRYGDQHEVRSARSGSDALDLLRDAQGRSDPVALVLADQRMPRQAGQDVLAEAHRLAPSAKRVLLTLHEDADAGLQAINAGQADDYLVKPWEQPERRAFPLLDDLIQDWHAGSYDSVNGIQVIGSRWSPASHQVRDFLARNLVPYRWLDVETDEGRGIAERVAPGQAHRALVVFPDGTTLDEPSNAALAEKAGLRTHAEQRFYDLLIVGAGPAGLAAAVYAASEGLHTALVEVEAPGGQAGTSSRIENYLGFPAGLSGSDLARRAVAQARRFGAELLTSQEATGVRLQDSYRVLTLADGSELSAHALVIATGVSYRTLDVPGSDHLNGAGVYYGSAMSEAFSYRDQDIYIVGGANSAGQAAVYLAGFARRVTMLVRGPGLSATMSSYLIDQLAALPNVVVRPRTQVVEAHGGMHLEGITVRDDAQGTSETLPAMALFVFVGATPRTEWLAGVVERDEGGYILTGAALTRTGRAAGWTETRDPYLLETSVPGIFAAGDVRHGSIKRVASGVGEGAMAVSFVHQYLASR